MTIIRLRTPTNPLGLRLGDRVNVKNETIIEYTSGDKKTLRKEKCNFSSPLYVVGAVKRATGQYIPRVRYSLEDDPPRFKTDKYHYLYECKLHLENKVILVHPDDIELEK